MASRSSWKDLPLAWRKRQMTQAEAPIRLARQLLEEPMATRQRMIPARRPAARPPASRRRLWFAVLANA